MANALSLPSATVVNISRNRDMSAAVRRCAGARSIRLSRRTLAQYRTYCASTEQSAPINKQHGGTVMNEQLYSYLLSHTPEHKV